MIQQTDTRQSAENLQAHYQEFVRFLENTARKIYKNFLDGTRGLQITKGDRNRVVYDRSPQGFRNELTSKDIDALKKLITRESERSNDSSLTKNNYKITYGGETLFQQDNDGTISVNEVAKLDFVQKLLPGMATFEDYEQAFADLEENTELDSDRDGLTDREEEAYATDPQSGDTDGDGIDDSDEVQEKSDPTFSEDNLSEDNVKAVTANVVINQLNGIEDVETRDTLSNLVIQGDSYIQSETETTLDSINPYSKENQEISAAKVSIELLEINFQQNGETEYEAVDYNIKQKGFNEYEVTDTEGNLKLSFEREGLDIKIIDSQLEGKDYLTFANASKNLNEETFLEDNIEDKLSSLKGLAKNSDHQQYLDLKSREVLETASDFLHYIGAKSFDGEDGKYRIESDKKTFLTIEAKDGRGNVFSYNNGSFKNKLSEKDVKYFNDLNDNIQNLVAQKQQEQKESIDLSRSTKATVHKEKELSL